jgi:SAM-dependent methyltransferase
MRIKSYYSKHKENKMKREGDVEMARIDFLRSPSNNLVFLLKNRYEWMNDYIGENDRGIDVGSGAGLSKFFIKSKSFILTDYSDKDWLDYKNIDALSTPFSDSSFDFVVASNMIHHVPHPIKFLAEMKRILKPGGFLLIQEINASFFMRFILRIMKHEGYSFGADVFSDEVCTNPEDLWSANCAIPNLLFDDKRKFKSYFPDFEIKRSTYSEFFVFLNSGGVIAKTFYLPLPNFILEIIKFIDDILVKIFPKIFALQRQIVLQKHD